MPEHSPVYKVCFLAESEAQAEWLVRVLSAAAKAVCFSGLLSDTPFVPGEISDWSIHKGAALDCICRYLKAEAKDCIAFGDSLNDMEILQAAGIGIAMGNAEACVKELADQVCERCDEDGIARALARLQYKKLLGYRRGADGKPEIVPEEAETVRRIFRRYLEGASLGDIKSELEADGISTSEGIKAWSYQVIHNILTNEKYIGDALLLKTYVTDPISKKVVKNMGDQPMYYVENNHPAIIPKEIFNRAKEEIARRASKRKVMQKRGKTEQGKYSARYALSELLVCGECGTPYKRCTWARNGKKRIVWRCVSRLEFGTKYCHSSPTLDEDRLHRAIVAALNEYGAIRQEVQESAIELAGMAQDYGVGGSDLLALRRRLDVLTAEQTLLLDKVLEDMDNLDLNAQLKALAEEKQSILEQMAAIQEKAERQALQASRRRELEEWLEQKPMMFTEYDDGVTRRLAERITVVDAETIRVKLRDTDVEIEQKLC